MAEERKEIFIKNTLDVEVDGLKGVNTYTIKALYDVPRTSESGFKYYELEHRLVDEFALTWAEIEEDGGISQVNKDLKECYNV